MARDASAPFLRERRHRVLVIGLGRIGLEYDLCAPADVVFSHARAFANHPAFELAGGVDPSAARRAKFQAAYGVTAHPSLACAIAASQPDVVVVATRTETHLEMVARVLELTRPRALVCEKPLAYDTKTARLIVGLCECTGTPLYVNYMRRSDPTVAEISRRLASHRIATPMAAQVWYSRGAYNGASHFVNLLQHWLGQGTAAGLIGPSRDADATDPSPAFRITFELGEAVFLPVSQGELFHNSIELIANNGRLRYDLGGAHVTWQPATLKGPVSGYTMIDESGERLPGDFRRVQWHFADQLGRDLAGQPANICRGADALATVELVGSALLGLALEDLPASAA